MDFHLRFCWMPANGSGSDRTASPPGKPSSHGIQLYCGFAAAKLKGTEKQYLIHPGWENLYSGFPPHLYGGII
jgi:hypothetical protein